MPNTGDVKYRLVIFDEVDEPAEVRDLFVKAAGAHPTDATQWIAKLPGTWPWPLDEPTVRTLLDGLYDRAVAAEAWRVDQFPDIAPPRHIHSAACLNEGLRIDGLRGEPTHWVPWDRVEIISAGKVPLEDAVHAVNPPTWTNSLTIGLQALANRPGKLMNLSRRQRAERSPRDPLGEVIIVRRDPRIAFRIIENKMNYAYLGDRLRPTSFENFPQFLDDLVRLADHAYVTKATRSLLAAGDPPDFTFPSSQALLDHTLIQLLWSWYRRDRDARLDQNIDETLS